MSRSVTICGVAAVLGLCFAGQAGAQEMPASMYQAISHRSNEPGQVDYSRYYAVDPVAANEPAGQADRTPPAPTTESAPMASTSGGGCPQCEEAAEEENPCGTAWTLQGWLNPCRCEDSPWTYGGWLNGGISGNDHGVVSGTGNLPIGFNSITDAPMLNQAWLWTERKAKTDDCGWDWGFRADFIFGTDGPDTQAFGDIDYDNPWDSGRDYGSALPQLYGVLAYNSLNIKFGHFFTPIGYEVVPATGNFFYSHSYTMLYAEPFTHTGVVADYKYSDQWDFLIGWTQGWDSGFNNVNNANTFLGGFTYTSCDKNNSLAYMVNAGDWGSGVAVPERQVILTSGNIFLQSLVFTHKFNESVKYVLQSDLGVNSNLPTPSTSWYGVNQYLLKDINCCWSVGARFEWFRDEDGVRVVGGNAGNYYEATVGANWKPHTNVTVRPELRYDWFDGNGNGGTPYADGTRSDELTWAVDAWVTF